MVKIDTLGGPMPKVKFYRAGREIINDTRSNININDMLACASLQIQKTRIQDEAKYSVSIEQDGVTWDQASFSVFIKGKYYDIFSNLFIILITDVITPSRACRSDRQCLNFC